MHYSEPLDAEPTKSFSEEDLSRIWGLDIYKTRTIIRKLRKAGFVRRTRAGRFKLTIAGALLVRIYRRIKTRR